MTDKLCYAALVTVLAAAPDLSVESTAPPNVVVVVTDDQGYGDFSLHGNRRSQRHSPR